MLVKNINSVNDEKGIINKIRKSRNNREYKNKMGNSRGNEILYTEMNLI